MAQTCFVIMPFGQKTDDQGRTIDFDDVYRLLLQNSVESVAGIKCQRCDEIAKAGWIHAEMIKSIADAPLAIVDISMLNPNVFYELGVRHTLKSSGTVLIRNKGTRTPFNIEGFNCIDYDLADRNSRNAFKEKMISFLENALADPDSCDSLVYEVLDDLRVARGPAEGATRKQPISSTEVHRYEIVAAPGKEVGIITGDLRDIRICDVWVNSENTNMQMARYYDRSFSGLIRYLGASKSLAGGVLEDTIAIALSNALAGASRVEKATVIATEPGELERTNNVKLLLHVASVEGELGVGYRPIAGIQRCVSNALHMVNARHDAGRSLTSILFPVMGTGTGHGALEDMAYSQVASATQYMTSNPGSSVSKVYFSAYFEETLIGLRDVMGSMPSLRYAGAD